MTKNYPTVYKEEFPVEIIRLATEGKSMVQIAAYWKISKRTLFLWKDDLNKPDFMEAYKIARTCNEAYWEEIGQQGAKGRLPKFCAAAWFGIMKARFKDDWHESTVQKIELTNTIKKMTDKEINETIQALLMQRQANVAISTVTEREQAVQ